MSDGKKIFVSYREADTESTAGRIRDALVREFGNDRIFYDGESLYWGDNWKEAIDEALGQTDAMVVVIGQRWFDEFERKAASRERDVHKQEVQAALRQGVPIFLALVDDVTKLDTNRLPHGLKKLGSMEAQPLLKKGFMERFVPTFVEEIGKRLSGPGPAANDPRTVIVAPHGEADFREIAPAARAVPTGSTIYVRPGHYLEAVTVDRELQIVAEGERDEVVLEVDDGTALTWTAPQGLVEGLTVVAAARRDGVGVRVAAGRVTLDGCAVSARGHDRSTGVIIEGDTVRPVLRQCEIAEVQVGVVFGEDTHGRLEDCRIEGGEHGLDVRDGADPVLHGGEVRGGTSALHVARALGSYEAAVLASPGTALAVSGEGAAPWVKDCRIEGVRTGVAILDGAGGTFTDLEVAGEPAVGVEVAGPSAPELHRVAVVGGGAAGTEGFCVGGGSSPRLLHCNVTKVAVGLVVSGGSRPDVEGLRVHEVTDQGVLVTGASAPRLADCEISSVTTGLLVDGASTPTTDGLQVHGSKGHALHLTEQSAGTWANVVVTGSTLAGIKVDGGADPTFTDVTMSKLTRHGIVVYTAGRGRFERVRIEGSSAVLNGKHFPAIAVADDESNPTFRDFTVEGGASCGVWVSERGAGTFEDGRVTGTGKQGVIVETGGVPTFSGLEVQGAGGSGIAVLGGAPRLTRCTIGDVGRRGSPSPARRSPCSKRSRSRGAPGTASPSRVRPSGPSDTSTSRAPRGTGSTSTAGRSASRTPRSTRRSGSASTSPRVGQRSSTPRSTAPERRRSASPRTA
ncbi:MAG: right-handed parallel beta-helix repeat-containing protein [Acidimicrobiales bacterium]|nr:right-handed parallel beta-helix repeat-containing protein [Acidimicrobiales bacterium]